MQRNHSGVLAALAAFFLWGVLPLFWKQLQFLPATTIVAQRTLWSLVFLLMVLLWRREGGSLLKGLTGIRPVAWLLLSGLLLASNWLLYVWATLHDRIVEGALGYYLNPFFNMLFGAIWFGERQNRMQALAIAIALAGVALQIPAAGHFPWVALTLAVTFSLYAVVKKISPMESRVGLTAEALVLSPIALAWLVFQSGGADPVFGGSIREAALVVLTGAATTLPLLCFGHAAKTIRLTTLGILQFLGPTLQFLIGWQIYGEPMSPVRLGSFALIWLAVTLYAVDGWRRSASQPATRATRQ